MCQRCNWQNYQKQIGKGIELIETLPDAAQDFVESVTDTLTSMDAWIAKNKHITPGMINTFKNILRGAVRWTL